MGSTPGNSADVQVCFPKNQASSPLNATNVREAIASTKVKIGKEAVPELHIASARHFDLGRYWILALLLTANAEHTAKGIYDTALPLCEGARVLVHRY